MSDNGGKPYDALVTEADLDYVLGSDDEEKRTQQQAKRQPVVRWEIDTVADVAPEPVEWLWKPRIPLRKLTILEGHPGVGKSTITHEIAAAVSTGRALPGDDDAEGLAGQVLILTAEDGVADTVRPRLEAAGADLQNVHVVRAVCYEGSTARDPELPGDIEALTGPIMEYAGTRLVIVDPLSAFLAGKTDTYKDHDIRRALAPLARVADDFHIAILVVRHLTKATSGPAILAGGGSIGIIGAARSSLLAAVDPEDEKRRVLAVVKANLAAKPPSLSYAIAPATIYRNEDEAIETSRIRWLGESAHSADALIQASRDHEARGELEEAIDWLKAQLADGPKEKKPLVRQALAAGIATRTLERAKEKLSVVHKRKGFGEAMTVEWSIPATSPLYTRPRGENGGAAPPNRLQDNGSAFSPTPLARLNGAEYLTPDQERLAIAAYERRNGGAA